MSQQDQLSLQQDMDQRSKVEEGLSNAEKSQQDTQQNITQNMK